MIINVTYFQLETLKKLRKVSPISSIQEVRHNPFNKSYNNREQHHSSEFEKVLDERIKIYQKGAQK